MGVRERRARRAREGAGKNIADLQTALDAAEGLMGIARENFDRDGRLTAAAFLFGTRADPETGTRMEEPGFTVTPVFQPRPAGDNRDDDERRERDKDEAVARLRELACWTQCSGIAFLGEMWTAAVRPGERWTPGHVNELPGAREIAYFVFEHRDLAHPRIWVADILRPAGKKPTLGPFRPDSGLGPGDFMLGRFVGLLERPKGA